MRICTNAEMRELDRVAEMEYGISPEILMENAGRAAVSVLFDHFPKAGHRSEILVFAGKGNNAGDAFVVARRLLCLDRKVRVFHLVPGSEYRGATQRNFEILQRLKAKMMLLETSSDLDAFFKSSPGPYLAIDGIIGTGLKGPLNGIFRDVVDMINANCPDVVALDIPTGVSGDTGMVQGDSIMAALTLSFGFPKLGHFLPPGAGRRGKLVNVDISLPARFRREGNKHLVRRGPLADLLKNRDRYGHKNSFGHTLLVGGSPGKLGAITMAAKATQRMGTGLSTVATWPDGMDSLLTRLPDETMAVPIAWEGEQWEYYRKNINHQYSSVVVGPGMGRRPESKEAMVKLLTAYDGPLVIDADALNVIADHDLHGLVAKRQGRVVLTPHPGEMARLLKIEKSAVLGDPLAAVKKAVELTYGVVLLKGAATIISSPDDRYFFNHYPNDGMATAGSGDVLAGMIGGLVGQGMDTFNGTLLAVYLHSLAGDFAARAKGHRSMTAPDIIENIANAFQELKEKGDSRDSLLPEEARAHLL
ncbi:MAG: NAD(P)H-hydrate dehydratase [Bdellovibrionales bacterium]|nr:NAD(P)H-hydrate dehydratase [Bdellovibrionales bacterium]